MPQTEYKSAVELLLAGERALCILTDGTFLDLNGDGTGSSGWWVMSPDQKFDRVIIYKSVDGTPAAELYLARSDGTEGPRQGEGDVRDRYLVKLRDTKCAGITRIPWKEFATAGQNPIRYLSK